MMFQKLNAYRARQSKQSGFTLVEMLVSVTLVLLMMTMFASIFSMATDSVSKQRGISNHDQKARSLVTIMSSDFDHRTFRNPLPFYPAEDSSTSPTPFGNRAGYIYISTNDPYSGLDDFIQFTVNSDILIENTDDTPYFAKALALSDRTFTTATNLSVNPNQPEADDGSLSLDGTSNSSAAEVCYFVRNGNLYRRIQLLRKPIPVAGRELDDQPVTSRGYRLLSGFDNAANYDGQFWFDVNLNGAVDTGELTDDFFRHFDFAAFEQNYGGNQSARLLGLSALTNESISSGAANESLGNPRFRFGFHHPTVDPSGNPIPTNGLSREHTGIGGLFIGRLTQAETSASNFNWPQRPSHVFNNTGTLLWSGNATPGDPLDIRNNLTLNADTGVVEEFSESAAGTGRGGPRKMEDLLLANVHEMKVEIWDERLRKYTTPGHSELVQVDSQMVDNAGTALASPLLIPGDYHQGRRFHDADGYGPQGSSIGVFDTWHPNVNRDNNVLTAEHPPHIGYRYTPPVYPNGPTRSGLPLSPLDEPDLVTRRADNRGYWQPNVVYALGDVVFVPWVDAPSISPPGPADSIFQYSEMEEPKFNVAYRCVARQGSFMSAATPPQFATAPSRRVRDNDELEWESFDNRRPLTSIRITLRFMDQTSDTQRQLSLVIPLTDKK